MTRGVSPLIPAPANTRVHVTVTVEKHFELRETVTILVGWAPTAARATAQIDEAYQPVWVTPETGRLATATSVRAEYLANGKDATVECKLLPPLAS